MLHLRVPTRTRADMPASSTPREEADSLASRIASARISSANRRRTSAPAVLGTAAAPASDAPISSWGHGFAAKRHYTTTASTRGMVRPRNLKSIRAVVPSSSSTTTQPLADVSRNAPASARTHVRKEASGPMPPAIDARLGQCLAKHSRQWAQQVVAWEARQHEQQQGLPAGPEGEATAPCGVRRAELYTALRGLGLQALDAELDRCFDGHERQDDAGGSVGLRFLDLDAVQRTIKALQRVHLANSNTARAGPGAAAAAAGSRSATPRLQAA